MSRALVALTLLPVLVTSLAAQGGTPTAAVAAFHAALAAEDSAAAMALLDPAAIIFESGGAEMSAAEYAAHHLGADMEFTAATTRAVEDLRTTMAGDAAWVLTRSRTTGTIGDRPIDVRGVETMVLRRAAAGWRIVHIHWSSRRG